MSDLFIDKLYRMGGVLVNQCISFIFVRDKVIPL